MPIEIKELHIKVTVNQPQQGGQVGGTRINGAGNEKDDDATVTQTIEEVIRILKNKKER